MRLRILLTNGVALVGIAWMFAHGTEMKPSKLLPQTAASGPATDIAALEASASIAPTPENISGLAVAYLDRGQPGLASAVLDRAPAELRGQPEITQLRARALFQRGRSREALAAAKETQAACTERGPAGEQTGCPSWISAKAARQVAFFQELVDAGIEDPSADPGGTKAAYERSAHLLPVVAMR